MNKRMLMPGLIMFVLMAVSMRSLAGAKGWYAGVEGGYVEDVFKAHYEFVSGREPVDYTDPAYGVMMSLIGGYQFPLTQRLSLAVQGRVSADNAEWTLTTDDPADLSYSLPWAYSISLVPEIKIMERLCVFGVAGLGQGYIREEKNSLVASQYSSKEWIAAYSFGGGLRFQLSDPWQVYVQYRYTTYDEITDRSYLPDGSHWETIDNAPHSESICAGLTRFF